jgi:plasmid replication initiation protein
MANTTDSETFRAMSSSALTLESSDEVSDVAAVPVSLNSHSHAGSVKISRDEMNLAEFPLTVLSKRVDPSVKTLEFTDAVKGKNGELVNRKWIITGADKFGLPTSSDDEVLLGLLKLTADDGLRQRKIYFTRYELLKILRWTTEGRSYTRLQNALDRLSGVRIKATNAFYDNESKLHSTRNFGIIDEYEINDGRDTRPSFFTWSEVLFTSFQVGFIKKLDLDFYLDLESAVSKRLYRYLDKHFWYRSRIQMNLFTLAHEKIGISRNYVYASSLRQQIEPALDELKQRAMLSHYEFIGKGKSTEIVLTAAQPPRKVLAAQSSTVAAAESDMAGAHGIFAGGVGQSTPMVEALVVRGIAEKQARKLVMGQGRDAEERRAAIIAHFDKLIASESHLVSKNPQGFLYRAIEKPFDFTLPGEKSRKVGGDAPQVKMQFDSPGTKGHAANPSHSDASPSARRDLEIRYLTERKRKLDKVKAETASVELQNLRQDVEGALAKLRAYISATRFSEAVAHGVDEKLLERNGFPDFDKWRRSLED